MKRGLDVLVILFAIGVVIAVVICEWGASS